MEDQKKNMNRGQKQSRKRRRNGKRRRNKARTLRKYLGCICICIVTAVIAFLVFSILPGEIFLASNRSLEETEESFLVVEDMETEMETETETETETIDYEALALALAIEESEEKLSALQTELSELLEDADGTYGIYIQDLSTGCELILNSEPVYAASLIKLFVMESTYTYMDQIIEYDTAYTANEEYSANEVQTLLTSMITESSNEAYNELVRMHSASQSFTDGCLVVEAYISAHYANTGIFHTLHPSSSEKERTESTSNYTSAEDCGLLLASIYNGTCVSEEASAEMLELLLGQQTLTKIPAGLPDGVTVANKTGETSTTQHDAAIVFGEETDFVLVVTSTDFSESYNAIVTIREIASLTYDALNSSTEESEEAEETDTSDIEDADTAASVTSDSDISDSETSDAEDISTADTSA